MKVTIAGVDVSGEYTESELEEISVAFRATDGEVGLGTALVPDIDGSMDPFSAQQFKLEVGATVVFDGFLGPITKDRNGVVHDGNRMAWHHQVGDDNMLLNGHVSVWSRPAETDVARMTAFVDHFLGYLSLDTTWLLGTHAVNLPAKKYQTDTLFAELQTDCGEPSGKTMFIEHRRFHWHLPTEGITAGLAIVDAPDEDRITSFENQSSQPPVRSKDGMDLGTRVIAKNAKGDTYVAEDAVAIAAFDAWGVKHQRLLIDDEATPAQLATKAEQVLADNKRERFTYTGTIGPLTAEQVDMIPVGSLINCTDRVWGLTSSTQRIAGLTLKYVHPDQFMATLELAYPPRIRVRPPVTSPPPKQTPDQTITDETGGPTSSTDAGLEAGTPLSMSWYKYDDGVLPHAWVPALGGGLGTFLGTNTGWPGTPCGVSFGSWSDPTRVYAALVGTAPSDDSYVLARLALSFIPGDHGSDGFLAGAAEATHGPVIITAGLTGAPSVDDIDASGSPATGVSVGRVGQGTVVADTNVDINANAIAWGEAFRILFSPGWFLTTDYICVAEAIDTGVLNDGWVGVTATLTPFKLVSGAYGWLTAAPRGVQDGSNTTFSLIGGYDQVSDVYRNGLWVPIDSWKAVDGSTIQTIGWAPIATDDLQVRYRVPGTTGGGDIAVAPDDSVILTLTAANSVADMEAAVRNMTIDVIELSDVAGNFHWQHVDCSVDRSSRPLWIRPALGSTVRFTGPATTSGIIFMVGQTVLTKNVTFDGRPGGLGTSSGWWFQDIALAQSGVIEPRGTLDCTFAYLTFSNLSRNLSVPGSAEYKAWCFYISAAGSGSNDNLLIDHCWFKAPAVNRDVSCMTIGSSGSHGTITITNVEELDGYHYALAVGFGGVPVANLVLDTWTMTDTGRVSNSSSIRIASDPGSVTDGTYSNIHATGSEPFVNAGAGTMVDGGGNSGI